MEIDVKEWAKRSSWFRSVLMREEGVDEQGNPTVILTLDEGDILTLSAKGREWTPTPYARFNVKMAVRNDPTARVQSLKGSTNNG